MAHKRYIWLWNSRFQFVFQRSRTRSRSSLDSYRSRNRNPDMLLYYSESTRNCGRRTLQKDIPFAFKRLESDGTWWDAYIVTSFSLRSDTYPLVPTETPKKLMKDIHYLIMKNALKDLLAGLSISYIDKKWCPNQDLTVYAWLGKLSGWINVVRVHSTWTFSRIKLCPNLKL